ncbi:UDP-N-acetylglucosamine pyrophosphorylase [Rickettsia prowazekii str. GvF12]|nr:UDP-N-acetylglucosamine pyrophosphorylase [Rickettsia prowazekii str. NMRC Madrid E]EOB09820.1 UDP-N-acetylglucosamine pyrophosphorylase [Rickettsia prowazekii str. GvF12]
MAFSSGILNKYLPLLVSNNTHCNQEVYLTEIVKICKNHGEKVSYLLSTDHDLIVGINTQSELEEANNILSQNKS